MLGLWSSSRWLTLTLFGDHAEERDFLEPPPTLSRIDDRELREETLSLSSSEAPRIGVGKSTLHDLRKMREAVAVHVVD